MSNLILLNVLTNNMATKQCSGPVKVNQIMAVFGFKPKFQSFRVWVSALLSSLQLLTGKDKPKLNSVIAD